MDTELGHDTDEDEETEAGEEPVGGILEDLRDLREEIGEEKTVDLAINGYRGRLIARYRRIEYREVERIARKVEQMRKKMNPNASLYGQCDLLGIALEGVYLRKDPDRPEELIPLAEAYGSGAVRSGWDLAAQVVAPDGTAIPEETRAQIRLVFNNDLALGAHQNDLSEWMNAERNDEEEDFSVV